MNRFVWHALGLIFGGAALICGMLVLLEQAAHGEDFDPIARDGYIARPQPPHSVPEPASLAILGAGAGLVALRRRFRK